MKSSFKSYLILRLFTRISTVVILCFVTVAKKLLKMLHELY